MAFHVNRPCDEHDDGDSGGAVRSASNNDEGEGGVTHMVERYGDTGNGHGEPHRSIKRPSPTLEGVMGGGSPSSG